MACQDDIDAYIAHPSAELVVDKPIANILACSFSRKISMTDLKWRQVFCQCGQQEE